MKSESVYFLIPLLLGFTTICQTHLVQKMGHHYSLIWAAIINNLTGLVALVVISYFTSQKMADLGDFKLIYLIAGLLGISFVIGSPMGVSKIGPAKFFVILVAAEIIFGMLWQFYMDPSVLTSKKFIAATLVISGALLSL